MTHKCHISDHCINGRSVEADQKSHVLCAQSAADRLAAEAAKGAGLT